MSWVTVQNRRAHETLKCVHPRGCSVSKRSGISAHFTEAKVTLTALTTTHFALFTLITAWVYARCRPLLRSPDPRMTMAGGGWGECGETSSGNRC